MNMESPHSCCDLAATVAGSVIQNDHNQAKMAATAADCGCPKKKTKPIPGYIAPDAPSRCQWSLTGDAVAEPDPHYHRPLAPKPKILDTILDHVGHTPMVRMDRIRRHFGLRCELLGKCEFFNPGGSVKDRIGWRMVQDAERDGVLKPGYTIIEPTSGNTGIGLALAAAVRGYHCIIVMPEKMSNEKISVLSALGAEIIRTPNSAAFDSPNSHICVAQKLKSQLKNAVILDQYRNPSNPLAHYDHTGEEILQQCDGRVDMVVMGAGTGGTVTGVGRKIKEHLPECQIVAIDPEGSLLAPSPDAPPITFYEVEGIGYDFIPTVLDRQVVDQWVKIGDAESFRMARLLIQMEGFLCGGSSGSALAGALRAARSLTEDQRCVVLLPDSVRNYMTKFLDNDWMTERGFEVPAPRKLEQGPEPWFYCKAIKELMQGVNVKTISNTEKCIEAVRLMKEKGYDQLPVVEASTKRLIGMVTITDVMAKLASGQAQLDSPIGQFAQIRFPMCNADDPIGRLIGSLRRHAYVAVVESGKDGQQRVAAIITHIDIVNYLANLDHIEQL